MDPYSEKLYPDSGWACDCDATGGLSSRCHIHGQRKAERLAASSTMNTAQAFEALKKAFAAAVETP